MGISGKRILLIVPVFFDYHLLIKKTLEEQGAIVEMVINKIHKEDFRSSTNYFLTFIYFLINPFYKKKYTKDIIGKYNDLNFDILFAINGFSITKELLFHFKKINPTLKSYVFFWDSFAYWNYSHLLSFFDVKYSFDKKDCNDYADQGLNYMQDFYVNEPSAKEHYKYELCCITSLHKFAKNRVYIIKRLRALCETAGFSYFFKLVNPFFNTSLLNLKNFSRFLLDDFYRYIYILRYSNENHKFVQSDKIPFNLVQEIEANSKCILDIPPEKQCGLTIRSLEAIASSRKLITTNKMIFEEPFYHSNNILILNEFDSNNISDFLAKPIIVVDITYLRLDNWVYNMFK